MCYRINRGGYGSSLYSDGTKYSCDFNSDRWAGYSHIHQFFGMYLRTSISYQDQLLLGSMNNEAQLSNIFKTVVRIIVLTLSLEFIAAVLIFLLWNPTYSAAIQSR